MTSSDGQSRQHYSPGRRPGLLGFRPAVVAALLAVATVSPAWSGGAALWRNTRNVPFGAATNGPQGAIVVVDGAADASSATAAALGSDIDRAIAAQHSTRALSQAAAAVRFLAARGIGKSKLDPRFPRLIVHAQGNQLVLPDLKQALDTGKALGDPGNTLKFQYVGWSTTDQAALSAYLQNAMPVARSLYGPPAFNLTVKVIQDTTLKALQGGTYDVTTNEIRLPALSGNFPEDSFVLLMLVLNAFHDDVALFYDSWEQGMIGAAATAVQISPGVASGYDPANPGTFYSGSVYEPQNQPPLGNSTWYPDSGYSGMLVWRIAQARAAWFKCYVEDQRFFSRFNAQYYARLNGLSSADRTALRGDTASLIEICQSVLPTVEGLPFFAWYKQQYVLDTSVAVAPKLYTWNIPLTDAVALIVENYDTTSTGNETPQGGTANLIYFSYDFTRTLFAQEGNEITVPATGSGAGEGFLIPTFLTTGDPQRIMVQIELNGLVRRYPFAQGVRGFDPGQNNLYGAVQDAASGTLTVTGLDGLKNVKVNRGVWGGVVSKTVMSPAQLTVTFQDANGNTVSRKVNVAFDSYDVLLTAGTRTTLSQHLTVGTNGLYLLSVPMRPVQTDASAALGIPVNRLALARWQATAPGGGQYEIYPNIEPFQPGLGYWLRIFSDVTLAVDGLVPPADEDVTIPLYPGWNMIGCGRPSGMDISTLLVQRGASNSKTWPEAVTAGWAQAGVWAYDQTAGYRNAGRLSPWAGYWVRCLVPEGAQLIFPAATTASVARERSQAVATAAASAGTERWRLTLTVRSGKYRSEVTLGEATRATNGYDVAWDLQAPPAPVTGQPLLRFVHPDWGANSGEYVADFRPPGARGPWRLQVTGLPAGAGAVLRWPNVASVPAQYRPVLVDRLTGTEVSLRTTSAYRFSARSDGREFDLKLR